MSRRSSKLNEELAGIILLALAKYQPYIHARSKDSIYIHFDNLPAGLTHKLRISNHNERSRYGYKFQLRTDGLENIDKKEFSRYFDSAESLVKAFQAYYRKVEAGLKPVIEREAEPEREVDNELLQMF